MAHITEITMNITATHTHPRGLLSEESTRTVALTAINGAKKALEEAFPGGPWEITGDITDLMHISGGEASIG